MIDKLLNLFNKKIEIVDISGMKKSGNDFYEYLKMLYREKGAQWDEVNFGGIRDISNMDKDVWNDYIFCAIKGKVSLYKGTCDPSVYWTNKNQKGVAHICLGYYKDAYMIGAHKGYEAIVQWGNKIKIWRDKNNNFKHDDSDVIEEGYFGCNIHRAHVAKLVTKIGRYSAGCQVVRDSRDFLNLVKLVKSSAKYKRNKKAKFSYMLFAKSEIPEVYLQC